MGKLSGVNANLITKVSGVPVANISKVGPVLASSIGLGGGGKQFSIDRWDDASSACADGQASINKRGAQTLYFNESNSTLYTDAGFTNVLVGGGKYYWNQTDNESWGGISNEGIVDTIASC